MQGSRHAGQQIVQKRKDCVETKAHYLFKKWDFSILETAVVLEGQNIFRPWKRNNKDNKKWQSEETRLMFGDRFWHPLLRQRLELSTEMLFLFLDLEKRYGGQVHS